MPISYSEAFRAAWETAPLLVVSIWILLTGALLAYYLYTAEWDLTALDEDLDG